MLQSYQPSLHDTDPVSPFKEDDGHPIWRDQVDEVPYRRGEFQCKQPSSFNAQPTHLLSLSINSESKWFSEAQVRELIKKVQLEEEEEGEWKIYKSKSTIKRDKALAKVEADHPKKSNGGCYNCGEEDHLRLDCPTGMVCYECKEGDHLVAQCPIRANKRRGGGGFQRKEHNKNNKKDHIQVHINITPSMLQTKIH